MGRIKCMFLQNSTKKEMLKDKYMYKKNSIYNLPYLLWHLTLHRLEYHLKKKKNPKWKQNSYSFIFSELKRM